MLVDLLAVFFAEADFVAVDLVAVFFAGDVFLAAVDPAFFAGLFFAVDVAAVFFAVVFFAGADLLVDLLAVFFAGVDFVAVDLDDAAVFLPPGLDAPGVAFAAVARVSFGSFFAPETTAFRSAPALNFGTAVFLALMRSPVRGLRTHRASRTLFSKDPNPVIATFSPLATSRVMVSSTDSRAWAAALRLPS